jgi:predicted membrane-bound spermidine synthase
MAELSEIKAMAATAASAAVAANNAAVASSTALTERLFHADSGVIHTIQSDIQEIKDDRKDDKKWDRIHNIIHYSTGPILIAIHQMARKLGITI